MLQGTASSLFLQRVAHTNAILIKQTLGVLLGTYLAKNVLEVSAELFGGI